nr:unknown [Saccharomyces cerevisiae]CAA92366.1 unknown [Saccharomyces cerevisiae]
MKTPPNQEKNNEKISLLFSSQRLTIDVHPSSVYHIVLSSNNADRHQVTLSFTARSRMMPLTRARLSAIILACSACSLTPWSSLPSPPAFPFPLSCQGAVHTTQAHPAPKNRGKTTALWFRSFPPMAL